MNSTSDAHFKLCHVRTRQTSENQITDRKCVVQTTSRVKWGFLQNEDRRPENEDSNLFCPNKARTVKKPSQSVPQRKQM